MVHRRNAHAVSPWQSGPLFRHYKWSNAGSASIGERDSAGAPGHASAA
jgi:hypothetical protein